MKFKRTCHLLVSNKPTREVLAYTYDGYDDAVLLQFELLMDGITVEIEEKVF